MAKQALLSNGFDDISTSFGLYCSITTFNSSYLLSREVAFKYMQERKSKLLPSVIESRESSCCSTFELLDLVSTDAKPKGITLFMFLSHLSAKSCCLSASVRSGLMHWSIYW